MVALFFNLIRNTILILIFCAVAIGIYYFVSQFFLFRPGMGVGPSHHAQDQGAVAILSYLIIPYASVLSGYISAERGLRAFEAKHLAQNPIFYFSLAIVASFGPEILVFALLNSGLSAFTQIATTIEGPAPPSSLTPGALDTRFTGSGSENEIRSPETHSIASTFSRRVIDLLSLLLVIAPTTVILAVIVLVSFPAVMLLPPADDVLSTGLESGGMRALSSAFVLIPLLISGWTIVRPALSARNILARARKLVHEPSTPGGKTALDLRQFSRDKKSVESRPRSLSMQALYTIPGMQSPLQSASRLRLEDSVAQAFHGVAEFVATGNPDEVLPPLGANRFYLDSSDWKKQLASKIVHSVILVLIVEFTEATEWEIAELMLEENRRRTILCLPEPNRSEAWRDGWAKLQATGLPLPDVDDKAAAVVFPNLQTATVIRLRGHWGFWGDALQSAIVAALSGKHDVTEIDFGSRLPHGETILRYATIMAVVSFAVGYLIPLIGIDILEFITG